MDFGVPICRGILRRRYKRFLCDIVLPDGSEIVAHCANPGSMSGLAESGSEVWLLPSGGRLGWRWEVVVVGGVAVGVNTSLANGLVGEALARGAIGELCGYEDIRREVRFGENSRLDFLLSAGRGADCFVEVKSVTLSRRRGLAEFPDACTARGVKHLRHLATAVAEGYRGVMLFVVQRGDCDRVAIARDIDSLYGEVSDAVCASGVEFYAYGCDVTETGIGISRRCDFVG